MAARAQNDPAFAQAMLDAAITQFVNGEPESAKQILRDLVNLASFEETHETLALLKILALGQQDVETGRDKPVADVVARLRAKRKATGSA